MKKADRLKELKRIGRLIAKEKDISYGDVSFLAEPQSKKLIKQIGDITLAEWSGMSEQEFNTK